MHLRNVVDLLYCAVDVLVPGVDRLPHDRVFAMLLVQRGQERLEQMALQLLEQVADRFGDLVLEVSAVEEEEPEVVLGLDIALDAPVDTLEVQVPELVVLVRYLDLLDALDELFLGLVPLFVVLLCG